MSTLDRMVLDLAVEDRVGAWELIWRLQSSDIDADETLLRRTVSDMIQRGLLRAILLSDRDEVLDDQVPLSTVELDGHWLEPSRGDVQLRFEATTAGEEEYYAQ